MKLKWAIILPLTDPFSCQARNSMDLRKSFSCEKIFFPNVKICTLHKRTRSKNFTDKLKEKSVFEMAFCHFQCSTKYLSPFFFIHETETVLLCRLTLSHKVHYNHWNMSHASSAWQLCIHFHKKNESFLTEKIEIFFKFS